MENILDEQRIVAETTNLESQPSLIIPASLFTLLWIATLIPIEGHLIYWDKIGDTCTLPDTLQSLGGTAIATFPVFVLLSLIGIWSQFFGKKKKELIAFGLVPIISILLGSVFFLGTVYYC